MCTLSKTLTLILLYMGVCCFISICILIIIASFFYYITFVLFCFVLFCFVFLFNSLFNFYIIIIIMIQLVDMPMVLNINILLLFQQQLLSNHYEIIIQDVSIYLVQSLYQIIYQHYQLY